MSILSSGLKIGEIILGYLFGNRKKKKEQQARLKETVNAVYEGDEDKLNDRISEIKFKIAILSCLLALGGCFSSSPSVAYVPSCKAVKRVESIRVITDCDGNEVKVKIKCWEVPDSLMAKFMELYEREGFKLEE